MRSPLFVARLAAFTIALLLLAENVEPGWGVQPAWGWYLAIVLLTMMTILDLVSFVAFCLAFLVLIGVVDDGKAANVALTIFTGVALLKPRGDGWMMRSMVWRSDSGPGRRHFRSWQSR